MPNRSAHVQYRVPYADTDRMGVVYYANYLVYFERARNEFLRNIHLPYAELEGRGVLLPVTSADVNYKWPAEFDDLLDVYGWIDTYTRTQVRFVCEVYQGQNLLVNGNTVHVALGRESRKPVKLPPEVAECGERVTRL